MIDGTLFGSSRGRARLCWCKHGRLRTVLVTPAIARDVRERHDMRFPGCSYEPGGQAALVGWI